MFLYILCRNYIKVLLEKGSVKIFENGKENINLKLTLSIDKDVLPDIPKKRASD